MPSAGRERLPLKIQTWEILHLCSFQLRHQCCNLACNVNSVLVSAGIQAKIRRLLRLLTVVCTPDVPGRRGQAR